MSSKLEHLSPPVFLCFHLSLCFSLSLFFILFVLYTFCSTLNFTGWFQIPMSKVPCLAQFFQLFLLDFITHTEEHMSQWQLENWFYYIWPKFSVICPALFPGHQSFNNFAWNVWLIESQWSNWIFITDLLVLFFFLFCIHRWKLLSSSLLTERKIYEGFMIV